MLMPGEELRGMVTGLYSDRNGVLAATNRRLLFFDKRLTGEQIEDFPYKGIGSIQHETGLFGGTISITAAGRKTKSQTRPGSPSSQVLRHSTGTVVRTRRSRIGWKDSGG